MNTTVSVNKIAFIPRDKNGQPLELFVLHLSNDKQPIIRRSAQFLNDLKGSFIVDDRITSIRHPEVRDALKDLQERPFTVTGQIKYCKKGDLWTVREESSIVTDPNHPKYNTVVPGDKVAYETDMTIVEDGFLTVRVNPLVSASNKDSLAKAKLYIAMMYEPEMESATATTQSKDESQFNEEDIDSDVLAHALGATGKVESGAGVESLPKAEAESKTAKAGTK